MVRKRLRQCDLGAAAMLLAVLTLLAMAVVLAQRSGLEDDDEVGQNRRPVNLQSQLTIELFVNQRLSGQTSVEWLISAEV
jgi:hypothetical protein